MSLNSLPLWKVLETDFGDGSAFLHSWAQWLANPQRARRLHHVALVGVPPAAKALLAFIEDLPELSCLRPHAHTLKSGWIGLLPGLHRLDLQSGHVSLTLCVDNSNRSLRQRLRELVFDTDVIRVTGAAAHQATDETVRALALRCRRGTRLSIEPGGEPVHADWSRVLTAQGFELSDNADGSALCAVFNPQWEPRKPAKSIEPASSPGHCVVIGAGLAGASAAYSLAGRGWRVTVLDQADAPASGASGLPAGVIAPHVSADDRWLSKLTRSGVRATLQRAGELLNEGVDWRLSGVLERRMKDSRELPAAWREPDSPGQDWSRPADARVLAQAGLTIDSPAHWHAMAGWVKPAELVNAMLQRPGISWLGGQQVSALRQHAGNVDNGSATIAGWSVLGEQGQLLATADVVVVAAGYDTLALLSDQGTASLPLNPLRGQVVWGRMPTLEQRALPPFPVNGLGSLIGHVEMGGESSWITGSTFERGCALALIRPEDMQFNREKLQQLLPAAAAALEPLFSTGQVQEWAGVRCTAPDRLPLVGALDPKRLPGLMVCTAMGARGLTFAVLCGEILAAQLHGEPLPVSAKQALALAPDRWSPSVVAAAFD